MAFSATRIGYVATEIIGDVLTKANFDRLPGGMVAYAGTTTNSAVLASSASLQPIVGATIAWTANASRLYSCTVSIPAVQITLVNTVTLDLNACEILSSTSLGSVALFTSQQTATVATVPINWGGGMCQFFNNTAITAGSHTWGGALLVSGGGFVQILNAPAGNAARTSFVMIRDEGPLY